MGRSRSHAAKWRQLKNAANPCRSVLVTHRESLGMPTRLQCNVKVQAECRVAAESGSACTQVEAILLPDCHPAKQFKPDINKLTGHCPAWLHQINTATW